MQDFAGIASVVSTRLDLHRTLRDQDAALIADLQPRGGLKPGYCPPHEIASGYEARRDGHMDGRRARYHWGRGSRGIGSRVSHLGRYDGTSSSADRDEHAGSDARPGVHADS